MSYILNALRKSEQERLKQQADSAAGKMLGHQPQVGQKSYKLIIVIVLVNLVALSGLGWYVLRKDPAARLPETTPAMTAPNNTQTKQEVIKPVTTPKPTPPLAKKADPATPSIANLINAKKNSSVSPKALKPIEKKPEPLAEIKPVVPMPIKPSTNSKTPSIPWLSELSPEFRRTVPDLKINVFVYAKEPAERFVMIDMVKYTVGQHIKDSLALREIRADSLVVEYNHQLFRIERP